MGSQQPISGLGSGVCAACVRKALSAIRGIKALLTKFRLNGTSSPATEKRSRSLNNPHAPISFLSVTFQDVAFQVSPSSTIR